MGVEIRAGDAGKVLHPSQAPEMLESQKKEHLCTNERRWLLGMLQVLAPGQVLQIHCKDATIDGKGSLFA